MIIVLKKIVIQGITIFLGTSEVRGTAVPQPCVTYGIHFFTIPIPRNSILAWFLSACLLSPLEEQAEKTPTHGLWGAAKFPIPPSDSPHFAYSGYCGSFLFVTDLIIWKAAKGIFAQICIHGHGCTWRNTKNHMSWNSLSVISGTLMMCDLKK